MKSIALFIIVSFISLKTLAQADDALISGDTTVFHAVETPPSFPGGPKKMSGFIYNHVRYPHEALLKNTQGKVYVQFIVEKDGQLTDVKVIKSVSYDIDKEAIRVIKSMPRWIPGVENGAKVRTMFAMPMDFRKGSLPSNVTFK